MKTKSEKALPKMMPGTMHAQYVKCGKQNCKCANGELHGAYYYHFVRVGGKLRKRYIKASEVKQIRIACQARQREQNKRIEMLRKHWQKLREIRQDLRDLPNNYI